MFAAGNRHPYHEVDVTFNLKGSGNILLAVHDQRIEMITTNKPPNFVGYMRSGVGIPYAITTKSGQPFAVDVANVVAKGLGKCGFTVKIMPTSQTETHEQLVEKMKATNSGMMVVLHFTEWHSDSYQAVWYNYNVVLQVYDATGKFLGQKQIEGKEHVGTTMWNPVKLAKKNMPPALKARLEEIFNSPEITAILK